MYPFRAQALAELLLQFGASPFQANGAGRTCMDEAVLEGAGNLLRRFEQLALWRGDVAVKVTTRATPHDRLPLSLCPPLLDCLPCTRVATLGCLR